MIAFAAAGILTACGTNSKQELDSNKQMVTLNDSLRQSNFNTDTGSMVSVYPLGVSNGANAGEELVKASKKPVAKTETNTGTTTNTGTNTGSGDNTTTAAAPAKKKGWSKAAKGAVIGAGSGAVVGAVVSKNKGKGAIIGAVVGAAGGYVIGRSKDKKDGRVKN